ncbi:MAG: thiol:disulfide interchange protein [Bacteroidetes bacterium]|nr:thiol:disulfide interchange protein [Bacteroidota bacterium]
MPEPGNIAARADSAEVFVITGTEQNDVLNKYTIEINSLRAKSEELYTRFGAGTSPLAADRKDSLDAGLKVYEDEMKNIEKEYALQNVNKMAGTHIFMTTFYDYTVEEKEALFARMNAKTKAIPRIAELIAATEVEKKTSKGRPYIDFSMTAPDGTTVKLSDYVGKTDYLLIDFWASWCPDCLASFPDLTAFYARNKGVRFDIVGVSLDDEKDRWIRGIEKHKLSWHHMSDLQKWSNQGAKLYAVNSIPATVLIDRNGNIAGRNLELKEIQDLLNQIVTK